jgi:hypothetical protein
MMDPDHAKRVLEHQEKQRPTPVESLARSYSVNVALSSRDLIRAEFACRQLVENGYMIIDLLAAENDPLDMALVCNEVDELTAALLKLSNEVLGILPLMEPLVRQGFGNSNYAVLLQRAEEARELVKKAKGIE